MILISEIRPLSAFSFICYGNGFISVTVLEKFCSFRVRELSSYDWLREAAYLRGMLLYRPERLR